jgi:hypothetical protein
MIKYYLKINMKIRINKVRHRKRPIFKVKAIVQRTIKFNLMMKYIFRDKKFLEIQLKFRLNKNNNWN